MINLTKGGRISLSKDEDGNSLDKIFFGTNWGMIKKAFGLSKEAVDLDSSVVLLDANGNLVETVYYAHKDAPGVHHYGDDLTGDDEDDGMDNETVEITLSKLESRVEHVFFVLNSFNHQKFDKIPYIGIRIYVSPNNKPKKKVSGPVNILASYSLKDDAGSFQGKESIILGEAYRRNGEWKFRALGEFGNIQKVSDFSAVCKQLI
jgi:tellurium resistance protein TerZ